MHPYVCYRTGHLNERGAVSAGRLVAGHGAALLRWPGKVGMGGLMGVSYLSGVILPMTQTSGREQTLGDALFAAFLLVTAGVMFWGITLIDPPPDGILYSHLWPILIVSLFFIGSASIFLRNMLKLHGAPSFREAETLETEASGWLENRYVRSGITILLVTLYAITANSLGFWSCTPPFVALATWHLGEKRFLRAALTGVLMTGFFILFFGHLVDTPLPRGVGVFKSLSFLFY